MSVILNMQTLCRDVLLEKYAYQGEKSIAEVQQRVARALASVEADTPYWEAVFLQTLQQGFIPGGRINAAAVTALQATLLNCFVQPVADSVAGYVDGRPGIYLALQEAAETMRRGGGVGYDFLR
jgi:ribonucleoside-diphosphate reductase alpha chain